MEEFLLKFYRFIHENDKDYLFDYEKLISDFIHEWKQEENCFPVMNNIYSREFIRNTLFEKINNFSQWSEGERERIIDIVCKIVNEKT